MIYRKRGTVARWENGTLIRVIESGVAVEEGDRFECHPDPDRSAGEELLVQPPAIELPGNVQQERFIFSHGVAEHACGDNHWFEEAARLHLSIVRERMRVLVDEGTYRAYRPYEPYRAYTTYSELRSLTDSQLPNQPASMPPATSAAIFCHGRKPANRKPQRMEELAASDRRAVSYEA